MAQWVKDPALSLLWHGFNPWPGEFLHSPGLAKNKTKNKKKQSSQCGSAVINPSSIHEDVGSIPGLTWWIKDLALQ